MAGGRVADALLAETRPSATHYGGVTLIGLAGAVALLAAGLAPYRRSVAYRAAWTDRVSAN